VVWFIDSMLHIPEAHLGLEKMGRGFNKSFSHEGELDSELLLDAGFQPGDPTYALRVSGKQQKGV